MGGGGEGRGRRNFSAYELLEKTWFDLVEPRVLVVHGIVFVGGGEGLGFLKMQTCHLGFSS